jgi:crossover junction endodeoxyribonuclease RuvC
MYFLGLDPGHSSGAWGVINHNGEFVACGDIEHDEARILPLQLRAALLGAIPASEDALIIIEQVNAWGGQGIVSTAKFMRAAGCIEAVAALSNHPVVFVTPQMWKKSFGLIKKDKKESLYLAREKFPTAPLRKIKDHNKAEALLMALWGLQNMA